MEMLNTNKTIITSLSNDSQAINKHSFEITSNWLVVDNTKILDDVISCDFTSNSMSRMTLDDIVNEEKSLEIKPNIDNNDDCIIEIKMKINQKIIRIGIVSEASVLEIFRDSGEYATTKFAEFIDEFEGASVYFGEVTLDRPTSNMSIAFKRIKNHNRNTMFLYGIRIIVEETKVKIPTEQSLDFNFMKDLFEMTMGRHKKNKKSNENDDSYITKITNGIFMNPVENQKNIDKSIDNNNIKENEIHKKYLKNENTLSNNLNTNTEILDTIDIKLQQMEQRIMNKLDLIELNTNKKLNHIIMLLETIKNN